VAAIGSPTLDTHAYVVAGCLSCRVLLFRARSIAFGVSCMTSRPPSADSSLGVAGEAFAVKNFVLVFPLCGLHNFPPSSPNNLLVHRWHLLKQ